jgi:hypothetical protein
MLLVERKGQTIKGWLVQHGVRERKGGEGVEGGGGGGRKLVWLKE